MFNKVAIIGVGLLGGSLARDLRAHKLANSICGVTRSSGTAKQALALGVVDSVGTLTEAVSDADLVVLATPMQAMPPILQQIQSSIGPNTVLTDVGSVKTDLFAKLAESVPQLLSQFVFAHPIAGGENSGVEASKEGLFKGRHVILTPTEYSPAATCAKVKRMWDAVGASTLSMSLQEHDAIFAKTSHLPHVVAFSLVNYLRAQENREQLFDLAAAGFYDFTRIASSDAEMWRDICVTNEHQVLSALDGYLEQVQEIRDCIARRDQQAILDYFNSAKLARDGGLMRKNTSK